MQEGHIVNALKVTQVAQINSAIFASLSVQTHCPFKCLAGLSIWDVSLWVVNYYNLDPLEEGLDALSQQLLECVSTAQNVSKHLIGGVKVFD